MARDDLDPKSTVAGPALRPTRTRHWVIVFAMTLAIITYIDRVCISQAMPHIQDDLGLDDIQKGTVFLAFGLAYALFEIPTGAWGDKLGPRTVLIRIVLWWSFFTAATGRAWSLLSLCVTRFLFGAGEAGAFPNLTKIFTLWLPRTERSRAQGIMWMSARWGGAFTPLLVVWTISLVSWRNAFAVFGLLGVVWAVIFCLWFRDRPRDHPGVNAAELELLKENERNIVGHAKVPWGKLVTSPTVWMLWGQYFCISYGWYFYVTWLPTYLKDARGMTPQTSGWKPALLAGAPLFLGGIGCLLAGFLLGWLVRRSVSVGAARRLLGFVGCTAAAGLLLWSAYIKNPELAMLSMGLAGFANDLTLPGAWSTCMDVGGRFAGTLSGSMNMMGNFGGMAGPFVVGCVLQFTDRNWELTFWLSSAIYFLGGLCWLFMDPVTPLEIAREAQGPAPSREPAPV
ncbi:MAG: MFS transporter [Planctomycetes bacterium]|jgi:MFS family permease|nr:MFS transporter [Planctomycetota bacterium]